MSEVSAQKKCSESLITFSAALTITIHLARAQFLNKYKCTTDLELQADAAAYRPPGIRCVSLTRRQHLSAKNDIMAAVLKMWRQIENPFPLIDVYSLEKQSCRTASRSALKRGNLRLSEQGRSQQEEQQQDERQWQQIEELLHDSTDASVWSWNNWPLGHKMNTLAIVPSRYNAKYLAYYDPERIRK